MSWTKDTAIAELISLEKEIDELNSTRSGSSGHIRWQVKTLEFLEEVFGRESRYYQSFAALPWQRRGSFIIGGPADPAGSFNPQAAVDREHHKRYLADLDAARGLLGAARESLERKGLDAVYEGKNTAPEVSEIVRILNLAERKLRKVIKKQPDNEGEVQDAFESLLIGADIGYSREADSIEYSSKTYIPDFTVSKAELAIEIKFCGRKGREKEIIAEINDDILAYKTKYRNLLFVIYDTGFIRDVDRFAGNFEDLEGVLVKVVKH